MLCFPKGILCLCRNKFILALAFQATTMTHPSASNAPSLRYLFSVALRVVAMMLVASGAALAQAPTRELPQLDLPRIQLSAGMHLIDAQMAQTPEQRQIGLMHRRAMPVTEGMLFVFEQPATQCFWMKNTLLPLTAAFVADDGRVVNLVDMQPQSLASHCSAEPVRFVLEMNQGWFAKRGVKVGSRLSGQAFRR